MKTIVKIIFLFTVLLFFSCPSGNETLLVTDYILIDHTTVDIRNIPDYAITEAKESLRVAYNHTSHGSQLITGMNTLASYPAFNSLYSWNSTGENESLYLLDRGIPGGVPDLSQGDRVDENGDTPWVLQTRAFLDSRPDMNVIIWSWCSINNHNSRRYLDNMEKLISEYPEVHFVFMTGHAEGQGEDLRENSVHYNNEMIREHCRENNRILYDFADIEAWNPDGVYFWDRSMRDNLAYSGGNWAVEWIENNPQHLFSVLTTGEGVEGFSGCNGTAHSSVPQQANLNGVLKGMAAWHLFARLAGWNIR